MNKMIVSVFSNEKSAFEGLSSRKERVRDGGDVWLHVAGDDQDVEVRPRSVASADAAPAR